MRQGPVPASTRSSPSSSAAPGGGMHDDRLDVSVTCSIAKSARRHVPAKSAMSARRVADVLGGYRPGRRRRSAQRIGLAGQASNGATVLGGIAVAPGAVVASTIQRQPAPRPPAAWRAMADGRPGRPDPQRRRCDSMKCGLTPAGSRPLSRQAMSKSAKYGGGVMPPLFPARCIAHRRGGEARSCVAVLRTYLQRTRRPAPPTCRPSCRRAGRRRRRPCRADMPTLPRCRLVLMPSRSVAKALSISSGARPGARPRPCRRR